MLRCLRVKVKGRVKIKAQGHGSRSRSNFWRAAVDIRGSALPSAAKSNNHHYQSKVIVCVSVISGVFADNCVDGVDRLLILYIGLGHKKPECMVARVH